ncbi:HAMP domain-containing protein [Paenibacillus sp. 1P07SE]|uniref:HAMP domain-containing protein n=1 Tax=Paenibacillus sp. 1P07SE TaxID=3132209 RepID=UPI0039A6B98E
MKSKLLLLLATTAVVAFMLVGLQDYRSLSPFVMSQDYTNISRVFTDERGAHYTIADSKTTIRKVSGTGKLEYEFAAAAFARPDTVQLFDSLTVDRDGYAYALVTDLDAYGLRVLGERIARIGPDGRDSSILYAVNYTPEENLFRVGKLQSLTVWEDRLYVLKKESESAQLMDFPLAAAGLQEPTLDRSVSVASENRYLNELTAIDPERLLYTTKRGLLFVSEAGEERLIYPASEEPVLNFPVSIVSDGQDSVYYIDHHEQAVMQTELPSGITRTWLPISELAAYDSGTEWEEFTSLAYNGDGLTVVAADRLLLVGSDGAIAGMQSGYSYRWGSIALRVAYWGLMLVLAGLAFALLRFGYIHVLRRKVSLLLKLLAVFVPMVLLSMLALFYSVYQSFSGEMKEDTFRQLQLLAGNGKYLVGTEHLDQLNSPRDYGSEDYAAIKTRLGEMFSQTGGDRDGLYNTVYRYMDGGLYLIMDDDNSLTMFQPFPLSEENLLVLEQGETVAGTWADAGGEWMYALGPLYNASGEIIGIYETGKDMAFVYQNNRSIFSDVLTIFVIVCIALLIVVTLISIYLLSSIRKLRRNVNLIASGEWDVKVDIRTSDEVGELGERFNMMASSINQYLGEVTKLSNSYFRFVPEQFLKVLGKTNMTQIHLGEQQNKKMAILICNMRGFDAFSAKLSTEETFGFINSFLKRFGPIIRENGGFISRYQGPGMLTMFPDDASAAVRAAVQIRRTLDHYNSQRTGVGYEPIEINISLHYGDVMLGIIGEEQRIESSVVSSHVALALELEKTAEKLGSNILLTQEAMNSIRRGFVGASRKLGALEMNGRQESVELYDLYEADPESLKRLKHETKQQFEKSIQWFRSGKFYDAREGFVEVVRRNRYDLAAKLYFFESDRLYQEGAANDWNHSMKVM